MPAESALDAPPAACARFHRAVELIGARWNGAIVRAIFAGHHRYAGIRAAVPRMSDTMLAQRLRELEAEGIVARTVTPSTPVRVEYHLTRKGQELEPVLAALFAWARDWIPHPADPPAPAAAVPQEQSP